MSYPEPFHSGTGRNRTRIRTKPNGATTRAKRNGRTASNRDNCLSEPNRTEPINSWKWRNRTEPNGSLPGSSFCAIGRPSWRLPNNMYIYIYIHTYLHIYNCMCYMCIIYIYIIVCVYIYIYIYTHIHTSHPRLPRRLQVPDEDAALGHDLEATAKVA